MLKNAIKFLLLFCMAGLLFSACDKKKTEDYSGTILNIPKRAQDATAQANLEALRTSVQAYRAANGKYPEDLKDAAALMGSTIDLGKYDYDPTTGAVIMKKTN
jgi:Type II secretion system (T2SS), protein G